MEELSDFKTYLTSKKIDAEKFSIAEPQLFGELKRVFDQMHPNSFTAQKLFLINPIRRKYQLNSEEQGEIAKPKAVARPKFKRP